MSGMRKMAAASAVVAASAALLTGCQTTDSEDMPAIGTPNPASVWCMEKGGRLEIVKDKDGNESGLCGSNRRLFSFFRTVRLPTVKKHGS